MKSVEGVYRFLNRVWRLIVDDRAETNELSPSVKEIEPEAETNRLLHKMIRKVTDDTNGLRFNTAIAAMMEFSNHLTGKEARPKIVLEKLVLLLAPYAPHIAEELWSVLGNKSTLAYEAWPIADATLLVEDQVEIPVQINGKIKAKLMVATGLDQAGLEALALKDPKVKEQLIGKTIRKVVAVPGKMVNVVAS
jgi:leucyl-tRNA synthetase